MKVGTVYIQYMLFRVAVEDNTTALVAQRVMSYEPLSKLLAFGKTSKVYKAAAKAALYTRGFAAVEEFLGIVDTYTVHENSMDIYIGESGEIER